MTIEIIANTRDKQTHHAKLGLLLEQSTGRVRVCALNVHDFNIPPATLSMRLRRLLGQGATVSLVLGQSPALITDPKLRFEVKKFLLRLLEQGARIYWNHNLHAKVVVGEPPKGVPGNKCAIVSSANLTHTAFFKNYELGVYFENESHIDQIQDFLSLVLRRSKGVAYEDLV